MTSVELSNAVPEMRIARVVAGAAKKKKKKRNCERGRLAAGWIRHRDTPWAWVE